MLIHMAFILNAILAQAPGGNAAGAPDALAIQVMLDRSGFSAGAIDGRMGPNTRKALEALKANGGQPDALPPDPLIAYRVTEEDVSGPFAPQIPQDIMAQAQLPALSYRTPLEALAERFHSRPALLQQLNPKATFTAGEEILVPNVEPMALPAPKPAAPAANGQQQDRGVATSGRRDSSSAGAAANDANQKPEVIVTVRKSSSALTVTDAAGRVLLYAPVTTGSEHDPLPIGEWKVNGVQFNPTFRYNPDLFWDADASHSKAAIPSGPNNPVGVVWIDISKPHYGIHGTPEPEAIGRATSHGCVRLTNWDALRLASLVKPGTRVVFAN